MINGSIYLNAIASATLNIQKVKDNVICIRKTMRYFCDSVYL